jgi:hypothetical protein
MKNNGPCKFCGKYYPYSECEVYMVKHLCGLVNFFCTTQYRKEGWNGDAEIIDGMTVITLRG